ncbi:MAG: GNAT family N-acetyltransferase [Chloroflexi bacterium]|nr:GNAT family N-acetyltransferase [Chloroflexota bacterium]
MTGDARDDGLTRIAFRPPVEADHRRLVDVVDHWFGRPVRARLGRMWFEHFTGTSLVGETLDPRSADPDLPRVVAFLVGFASPDRPGDAVIHLAAIAPEWRRRGFGTAIHERWLRDRAADGAVRASVVIPPDERVAYLFYRSLGFEPVTAGSRPLWGVPAFADHEGDGADRAILTRGIAAPS